MSTTTERRLKITPGTNIRWEPCYEMPDGEYNWALVSDESNRTGRVINPNTVLLMTGDCRTGEGKAIGEHPDLVLYADAHNTANACDMLPSEILAKLREAVKYLRHDEDCGTNAARGSYAFARGCSCGLDDYLDSIEHLTPPTV